MQSTCVYYIDIAIACIKYVYFPSPYAGYARLSNVEFYHTGQEGWTEHYDARYSLAFIDAGTVSRIKPTYIRNCAFHSGFSSAIGVYGTHGVYVEDSVFHHTVGPGEDTLY
jgi:hypothetical protein